MIDKTKITLSAKELELVCNKEWILTKQVIIQKVYACFGELALVMKQAISRHDGMLPTEVATGSPKISRGENYHGLPYIMLDYPRFFTKEDTVAIRTFFWWGNFFSINLHLSGRFKTNAIPALIANLKTLQQRDYFVCVHEDPWEHHFETGNYISLKEYSEQVFTTMLYRETFVKIAKKIPVQQWDAAPVFLENHFMEMIMMLLQVNYPGDETDP